MAVTGVPGRHGLTVAAVFWALAVGMAAGAGAVGKGLVDRELVDAIQRRLVDLEARLEQSAVERSRLQQEAAAYERVLALALPELWRPWIPDGWTVMLRTTSGARSVAFRLSAMLRRAGVTVAGGPVIPQTEWPWPVPGIALEAGEARVAGLVGRLPASPGAQPARRTAPGPPAGWVWVDRIETPLGQTAALVALVRCQTRGISGEEALRELERALSLQRAFQRGGACVEGRAHHPSDGGEPGADPVGR